jgi:hypothetical protein
MGSRRVDLPHIQVVLRRIFTHTSPSNSTYEFFYIPDNALSQNAKF